MALTAKHRSEIYEQLAPQWGDELTEAFLSQFPAHDGDELVTREFLRAELNALRTEVATEFGALRAEMATEFGALRAEMATEFGAVRAEHNSFRAEMATELGTVRAELNQLGSRLTGVIIGSAGVLAALIAGASTAIVALG